MPFAALEFKSDLIVTYVINRKIHIECIANKNLLTTADFEWLNSRNDEHQK